MVYSEFSLLMLLSVIDSNHITTNVSPLTSF